MTIAELRALIERDRRMNGRTTRPYAFAHVERHLGAMALEALRGADIERYKATRLEEKAAPGSINIELNLLHRGFVLAARQDLVEKIPHVETLRVSNAREGFLDPPQYKKLVAALDAIDPVIGDLARFLYGVGWRREEALGLTWGEVDLQTGTLALPAHRSKNRSIRRIRVAGDLLDALWRRWAHHEGDFVFQRAGRQVRDFRGPWRRARKAVGLPKLVPHDCRRSFCRNGVLAQVPVKTLMEIAGIRTMAIFHRYCILDEAILAQGVATIERYVNAKKGA